MLGAWGSNNQFNISFTLGIWCFFALYDILACFGSVVFWTVPPNLIYEDLTVEELALVTCDH